MGIVKRNSITITILSYLGIVVGYVNKILLFPNFLSEEQVGLANILVSMAVMYAQFSAMGINSTIVKFFPFFRTPDRRHNGFFFWTALGVSLGFVLFTTLFLIFREPVTEYYAQKSPLLSKYYLLLIPLGFTTLFFNFFTAWLQALYKTVVSSFVYEVALRLLVTAEISLYALGAIDFEQFIVGYVLIYFVPTLVLLVYTLWTRRINLRPVWTGRTRRLLSVAAVYGLWQYLGGTSMYIVPVIDQSMLAGMRGLAQQAVYSTMAYMVAAMLTPYRSMIKVATPVVTNLWKERDMEGMRRISREMSLVNLIVGSFLFLLIWVNLDNIFSLMPGSYSDGRYVFLFLGLARVMDMYSGLNGTILVTSKKYRYDFTFSLMLVALTVASNALLIPRWGMTGAALATMITVLAYNAIRIASVWKFYRIQPFALSDLLVVVLAAGCIGASALVPPMGHFIADGLIRSALVAALYGGAVYSLKLSPEINRTIDRTLSRLGIRLGRRA